MEAKTSSSEAKPRQTARFATAMAILSAAISEIASSSIPMPSRDMSHGEKTKIELRRARTHRRFRSLRPTSRSFVLIQGRIRLVG
jgi:hypothetical protein